MSFLNHCPTISGELLSAVLGTFKDPSDDFETDTKFNELLTAERSSKSTIDIKIKNKPPLLYENNDKNELYETGKRVSLKFIAEKEGEKPHESESYPEIKTVNEELCVKIAYNKHKLRFLEAQNYLINQYIQNIINNYGIFDEDKKAKVMAVIGLDPTSSLNHELVKNCNNPVIELLADVDTVLSESKFYIDTLRRANHNYE